MHELAHVRRRDLAVSLAGVGREDSSLVQSDRLVHPQPYGRRAGTGVRRPGHPRGRPRSSADSMRRRSSCFWSAWVGRRRCRERSRSSAPSVACRLRLESIANWSRPGLCWRGGFVAILIGLAAVGLTDAVRKAPVAQGQAAKSETAPTTPDAPAEVRISGRVEDHRGVPLAGAEVVVLGNEILTVYPMPQRGGEPMRLSWNARGYDTPPSVKTDTEGRFTIERKRFPVDRLAIISPKILLWEVPIGNLADLSNAVVKLPEPGSLEIDCDIPGKPETQEFHLVQGIPHPGEHDDILYYRDVVAPNPGRLVTLLPPGEFSIERINFTSQGSWGELMTPCERRLVTVDAGKTTLAEFNRKQGLTLEGRVRGLEDVKLRYARCRRLDTWVRRRDPTSTANPPIIHVLRRDSDRLRRRVQDVPHPRRQVRFPSRVRSGRPRSTRRCNPPTSAAWPPSSCRRKVPRLRSRSWRNPPRPSA